MEEAYIYQKRYYEDYWFETMETLLYSLSNHMTWKREEWIDEDEKEEEGEEEGMEVEMKVYS